MGVGWEEQSLAPARGATTFPSFRFRAWLFADAAGGQRAHQRTHYGQVFLSTREPLANQVIGGRCEIGFLQGHIGAEAIEEGELEVGRLT